MKNKLNSTLKGIIVFSAIALLIVAANKFNVQELLKNSLDKIQELGILGIGLFILIYLLACVLFLPGSILTLGAGAIFGVIKGSVIVSLSSTLGATCTFLIGRYLVRHWVESKIEGNPKFKAVDEAVAKEGWKIVGLTRLSPIFPFNLLNYAYGVTKVTIRDYILASWIGMMPGTVMYVYIGSLAGDIATLGSRATTGAVSSVQWTIRIIGFIATVLVTVYVTRVAKKALNEKIS
ncbi:MAG: hypothetical protein A3I11_02750 [Elusimicrobia bacterium RIFCSPLOWO2_02_FULL_39_32]|nr:MAG: hypothetical protein A3B80_01555 [Elusimicrobia bacterium RIFCSPHIGHO2_02_FULL_39_36]OGR93647.1 MAG: hypothetical protein A3I11_02750 [Elusimicrobia bacterium RIFCSPLOWO2_02_FULL_39_32]OGS00468.1 MAG: hypothetical protein A3G85_09180 [Elusimicrobia bacterium RIFCSPLOWO2_12_FULL_39_28]